MFKRTFFHEGASLHVMASQFIYDPIFPSSIIFIPINKEHVTVPIVIVDSKVMIQIHCDYMRLDKRKRAAGALQTIFVK